MSMSWSGDFSGASYEDVLIKKVLPCTKGKIECVMSWEGGDSFTGLQVIDGVVTECDVEFKLVSRKS